jgi:hypothetical protein
MAAKKTKQKKAAFLFPVFDSPFVLGAAEDDEPTRGMPRGCINRKGPNEQQVARMG